MKMANIVVADALSFFSRQFKLSTGSYIVSDSDHKIERSIASLILNTDAITDIVGANGLYKDVIPQGVALPAITYEIQESSIDLTMDTSSSSNGLHEDIVNISCWSDDYLESRQLGVLVKNLLDTYSGTVLGVTIKGCFFESENTYNAEQAVDELIVFGKLLEFRAFYTI